MIDKQQIILQRRLILIEKSFYKKLFSRTGIHIFIPVRGIRFFYFAFLFISIAFGKKYVDYQYAKIHLHIKPRLTFGLPKRIIETIFNPFFRVIFTLETTLETTPKTTLETQPKSNQQAYLEIINMLIIRNIKYGQHPKKRVSVENHTFLIPPKKNTPKKMNYNYPEKNIFNRFEFYTCLKINPFFSKLLKSSFIIISHSQLLVVNLEL